MVAFRKVLPVLALVVLMATAASAANPAFQCVANGGVPPLVRSEGYAESVGDLTLNCTGGPDGSAPIFVNVQIFLSTNITSNLVSGSISEALLMIDDPVPADQCIGDTPNTPPNTSGSNAAEGECTANMWLGQKVTSANNSIIWRGVPIVPPGSVGTRIIRVTNIRAAAVGITGGTYVPGQITEYISITGSTSVPVSNQPQLVAFVQDSLSVSISGTTGKQCIKDSEDNASITFTELFPSAFRKKIETDDEGAAVDQNTPGLNYVTESMFTNSDLIPAAGVANQGTRFIVKFDNVQKGVTVKVPGRVQSGTLYAVLVSANSDGSGGTAPVYGDSSSSLSTVSISSGAGQVVYEVIGTGAGVNGLIEDQAFTIPIYYSWTPDIGNGIPGLGSSYVSGNYAPINATNTASASAPEPRFREKFTRDVALTVSACRTILLFPYITNQIGFDTGIVISNTSSDPSVLAGSVSRQQQGPCTLYYFGSVTGGGAAPSAQTTQVIPTGAQLTFTLSGGGTFGAPGAPGFQGYMFAICEFQFAHGYAFVTKMGATDIAHGYLALIVPDRTRLAQAFSNHDRVNDGETLGY
ncbi:MAG: hypothetical protein M1541_19935 [Acidobacteria bacterium]|nr:hypothetical protein [Acidobacteriota bacterium]